VNDNGVMRMREVKGGIPLEEKGVTELKPGSYHVMFMGLKKPLKEGEKVPVTLKFKNAKPQTVQLEVKTAPQSGMDHGHGHG
ncbi:copper chaperone PCu(A)C, partial [Neisseria sp. P0015.S004]